MVEYQKVDGSPGLEATLAAALKAELGEDAGETLTICTTADISGGVSQELNNYNRLTLYLKTGGAIDVTLELSADGSTWYEPSESPISFAGAGDDVLELGYDATDIRLTGSNATLVTGQIKGVF